MRSLRLNTFALRKLNAPSIYFFLRGASNLFFNMIFTINLVYHATTVGLNPFQLVLVGTVLELTVFIFEVPTGVVADVYSRRLSVVIGFALIGLGFIVEGSFATFAAVLTAQVIWGIGATFTSGATEAWITDETGSEQVGTIFLRATQIGQVMGIIGTGISVMLASIDIRLPIVLGGFSLIGLALFLLIFMPEDGFHPASAEDRTTWRSMTGTIREGIWLVRRRHTLIIILVLTAISGMSSEGYDRLWRAHLLENFDLPALGQMQPIVWFGIINVIGALLSLVSTEIIRRRLDLTRDRVITRTLTLLYIVKIAAVVGFSLAGNFALALTALWTVSLLSPIGALFMTWQNRHIESNVRATVISMSAQTDALGQIAGGPIIGATGTLFSLQAAIALSGLILSPAVALFIRASRTATSGHQS